MYENEKYETILERALAQVPDTIDKRQGSIIYDALAPACIGLAQIYIELDNILQMVFSDTATGEFLDKRCNEFGVERKPASKALRKGIFTGVTPDIGSRFGLNELTYIVTDNTDGIDQVQLECEQTGTIGNRDIGNLIPIEEIQGLTSAVLSDILIPGEDDESDEELLLRYKSKIRTPSTSGNVYHYQQWANEVNGVGAVRVVPLWNGDNTVKVIIVNSDMEPATETLVEEVQQYIDPESLGKGEGMAPIGAYCTVASADSFLINVTATISGASAEGVNEIFQNKLKEYLGEIIKTQWENDSTCVVSYAKVGALLLEAITELGGSDYSDYLLNSNSQNIQFADEIPIIGTVVLDE